MQLFLMAGFYPGHDHQLMNDVKFDAGHTLVDYSQRIGRGIADIDNASDRNAVFFPGVVHL
jgi:hypothetical protein